MGLGNFIKGLFGKDNKQVQEMVDKVDEYADVAKAKVEEYIPNAGATIDNAIETVKEKAGELIDKAGEMAGGAVDTAKDKVADITDQTPKAADENAD